MTAPGACAVLLILAAVAIALILAGAVRWGERRRRRDRVSPLIRARVGDRVQRRGNAL